MARWNILNVPEDLARAAKIRAAEEDTSVRELVLRAVALLLKTKKEGGKQ